MCHRSQHAIKLGCAVSLGKCAGKRLLTEPITGSTIKSISSINCDIRFFYRTVTKHPNPQKYQQNYTVR